MVPLLLSITAGLGVKAQDSADARQRFLASQLYMRSAQIADSPQELSSHFSYLWMAYLADSTNASIRYDLGVVLFNSQQKQGLDMAERALEDLGYEYHNGLNLLRMASFVKDWDKVEQISTRLFSAHPRDKAMIRSLVDIYARAGKNDKALALLQGIAMDAKDPYLLFMEAQLLQKMGNVEEAEHILQSYMAKNPTDVMAAMMLISLYADRGDYQRAKPIMDEMRERYPDNTQLANLSVSIYALKGDNEEVKKELLRVATQEGSNPIALQELLDAARRMSGNLSQLLPTLIEVEQELTKLYPEVDQFALGLATDHFLRSDTLSGEYVLSGLVEKGTHLASPYYYFIEKSAKAEDIEGLRVATEKGLRVLPKEGFFQFYMALVEINSGDSVAYNERIKNAINIVSKDDKMYGQLALMRAEVAMEEETWSEAIPYFEIAVEKGIPLAYNNYAYDLTIYGKESDLNRAEELSRQAVQFDSENASYLDTYAWILYLKGAYPLARIYMERAIKYGESGEEPIDAVYYRHYGAILSALKEYDGALEAYKEALRRTPEDDQEALKVMEDKIKEMTKARDEAK